MRIHQRLTATAGALTMAMPVLAIAAESAELSTFSWLTQAGIEHPIWAGILIWAGGMLLFETIWRVTVHIRRHRHLPASPAVHATAPGAPAADSQPHRRHRRRHRRDAEGEEADVAAIFREDLPWD